MIMNMKTLIAMLGTLAPCAAIQSAELSANGVEVNGKVEAKCEWRRFDDGYAVRYALPEGARRIGRELTAWELPEDAVVWFQGTDRGGIADYEAPYESCKVGDIKQGRVLSLPVTAKLADGTYRMMTEANVVDYTDLAVKYAGDGKFVAYYHADRDGFDQSGESVTPWRVMLVAKDIQTLYGSDIVRRLCPEAPADRAKAVKERFAKPGRCIWQWLPAGAPKFHEQKDWYNRTKALGYEYYLIDEGWRGWGDDTARWAKLKECIDYGNSIGVKTFIWVHSNELMNPQARKVYLAKTLASGAVGIKIDFMPPPSFRIMKWYEETLADTFDAGLIVDFHGAVKPTGRERFWPHELAREAIRGHEYHITRYKRVLPFEHDTILPFCRLVQGHGDYTPMVFEKSQLIHFTWARQLAQGIVYACPFLCFGDFPLNYLNNPALGTIRSLAAVYDETRVLAPSEIGECVALARRKGSEWFVAVENGAEPREFDIPLDFLVGTFEASVFMDAADRLDAYATDFRVVRKGDVLHVAMREGGGYVAHLKPAKGGQSYAPDWGSLSRHKTPTWYENARFGIFCHWGMQCAAEDGDWYARSLYDPKHWQGRHHRERYGDPKEFGAKDLANAWKGENWNPDELCALYRKMGATFILAMANHHDNFDNWDSKYQPWNSVNMGPRRDVLGEWSAAARKNGLRFGESFHAAHAWTWLEVSRDYDGLMTKADGKGKWWEGYDPQQLYWQNHEPSPDYRNLGLIHRRWNWDNGASRPSEAFMENFRLRTMDAIAKYKPDLIYFDDTVVPFWPISDAGLRIVADFYSMNPDAVAAGKVLAEMHRRALAWDVERGTPPTPMYPKWQTDTCIGSWHYDRGVYERGGYKSAAQVLGLLVDVVSKNGNLCLSIPIRSDGTIDEKERAVCEDIAAWMAVNREALFDADPYEICGEGPQIKAAPPLSAQGFNEGRIPKPTKDDVRYMKSRCGRSVYAIELAPDGQAPHCPALEAKGLKLAESFKTIPGMPAVHVFR